MNDLEKKSIECIKNMPIEETTYQVARNVVLDYITNLQQDLENYVNIVLHERKVIEDYKSRIEKADWWLREMLKQAKSDETKAIISGTLELLLSDRSDE